MNYWYRFKLKGTFDIDIKSEKSEELAEDKAYDIPEKIIKGLYPLKVLEFEMDERGEWKE